MSDKIGRPTRMVRFCMGFFAFALHTLFLGALLRAAEVSIVLPEKKQEKIDRNKRIKNTLQIIAKTTDLIPVTRLQFTLACTEDAKKHKK